MYFPEYYHVNVLFFVIVILFFFGCEYPIDFNRDSERDPDSINFIPEPSSNNTPTAQTIEYNKIRIVWPKFFGVEKYQVLRRESKQTEYDFITEVSDFNDTTFTDTVPETGKYQYKISAVGKNGAVSSIESDVVLSNIVEGPSLYTAHSIAYSPTFAVTINDNKVFNHFLLSFSQDPKFTVLDLNSGEWISIHLQNYTDLGPSRRYLRSEHIYPLTDNEILIFKIFNESDSGWGQKQEFMGIICNLEILTCYPAGKNLLEDGQIFRDMTFSKLNETSILITGIIVHGASAAGYFAYIFDHRNDTIIQVPLPLENKVASTQTVLPDGNVLICGETTKGDYIKDTWRNCQIFNIQNQTWRKTSELPLKRDNVQSVLLDDGRVFLYGGWTYTGKEGLIYNPNIDSWDITPPSTYSPSAIDYYGFKYPVLKTSDGSVLVITLEKKSLSGSFASYFIEEYNPAKNDWVELYELPEHMRYIFNIVPVEDQKFIITYSDDYNSIRSAFFYR